MWDILLDNKKINKVKTNKPEERTDMDQKLQPNYDGNRDHARIQTPLQIKWNNQHTYTRRRVWVVGLTSPWLRACLARDWLSKNSMVVCPVSINRRCHPRNPWFYKYEQTNKKNLKNETRMNWNATAVKEWIRSARASYTNANKHSDANSECEYELGSLWGGV